MTQKIMKTGLREPRLNLSFNFVNIGGKTAVNMRLIFWGICFFALKRFVLVTIRSDIFLFYLATILYITKPLHG